jgi:Cytochrome c7 and related cytochrome c
MRELAQIRFAPMLVGCVAMLLASSFVARSQSIFEKLVMPGPLIERHLKLEKDCNSCHEPFSRKSQSRLCLACHKEVAADRNANRGYHGRHPGASKSDCRHCHTDHKGRTFDIVQLNRETFNHALTEFMLIGAHKRVTCDRCHSKNARFRDAPLRCFECHKSTDPHKGQLGEKCDSCHTEDAWGRVKTFDHTRTRFPLVAAHKNVACATCHSGQRYKNLSTTCESCHRLQDKHAGRYGKNCQTCHSPNAWRTVHFDHSKVTRFPLRGGHAGVKCDTCHAGNLYRDRLSTACVSCHGKDDPHEGQLGNNCGQCHNEASWRQKVAFDHDLTKFPLVGLHAAVPCEECHRTRSYKGTPRACVSCHKDTRHAGRLGRNCAACHNPNGWARWLFNHDKQTSYPLTGAHRGLQCQACHREPAGAKVVAPTDCFGCHRADDAHQGSFGRACAKCHNTLSFRSGLGGR